MIWHVMSMDDKAEKGLEDDGEPTIESPIPISYSDTNDSKGKEGGWRGWLTVMGSSLVYFSTFGVINSFGFFQELYQDVYLPNTPPSTIAFIGTLQITLMNILAAPAGSLFDRYGFKVRYNYRRHAGFVELDH